MRKAACSVRGYEESRKIFEREEWILWRESLQNRPENDGFTQENS